MPLSEYLVRIFGQNRADNTDKGLQLTPDGGVYNNDEMPRYAEITRQGLGWSVINTTAIAALVVRPSTVAMGTLFNANGAGSNICFIMDRAFAFNLVGTANNNYGIWLCVHQRGMAAPTQDFPKGVTTNWKGNTGRQYNGSAIYDTGATVVDDGWYPWGASNRNVTVTTPGGQVDVNIEGRLIVPPQAAISITVVADVVGATFTAGFSWYEKELKAGIV